MEFSCGLRKTSFLCPIFRIQPCSVSSLRYSRLSWLRCKKTHWKWEQCNLGNTVIYILLGNPVVGTRKVQPVNDNIWLRPRKCEALVPCHWYPLPLHTYLWIIIHIGPNEHLITEIDHIGVSTLRLTYSQ